jgi:hypothetical protein
MFVKMQASKLKTKAHYFGYLRFVTLVDKRAKDKRQTMFLINNVKLEAQRSKATLNALYAQKKRNNILERQGASEVHRNQVLANAAFSQSQFNTSDSDESLKKKVKQMCFDMLVTILHEAEQDKTEVSAFEKLEIHTNEGHKRRTTVM